MKYFLLTLLAFPSVSLAQTSGSGYPDCDVNVQHTMLAGLDLDGPDVNGVHEVTSPAVLPSTYNLCVDTTYNDSPAHCNYSWIFANVNDPDDVYGEYAACDDDPTQCDSNYVAIYATYTYQRAYHEDPSTHYQSCEFGLPGIPSPQIRDQIQSVAVTGEENNPSLVQEGNSEIRSISQSEMNESLQGLADRLRDSTANQTHILSTTLSLIRQDTNRVLANSQENLSLLSQILSATQSAQTGLSPEDSQTLSNLAFYTASNLDFLSYIESGIIESNRLSFDNSIEASAKADQIISAIDGLTEDVDLPTNDFSGSVLDTDIQELDNAYTDELARFEKVEEEGFLWGISLPEFNIFNSIFPNSGACQSISLGVKGSLSDFPGTQACGMIDTFKILISFLLWGYLAFQIKDDWVNLGGTR